MNEYFYRTPNAEEIKLEKNTYMVSWHAHMNVPSKKTNFLSSFRSALILWFWSIEFESNDRLLISILAVTALRGSNTYLKIVIQLLLWKHYISSFQTSVENLLS